jgi:hypothetical protein
VCSGNQFCDRDEGIEIIEKADLNLSSDSLTLVFFDETGGRVPTGYILN